MGQLKQQHGQTGLADTAANRLRHFPTQQRLVPLQFETIFISGHRQLALQRLSIHADPHRRKLECVFQHRVPDQNIAVQPGKFALTGGAPVIIIRRTNVVAFAIRQFAADPNQEYRPELFGDRPLAAFGIQIRETGQQFGCVQSGSFPAGTAADQTLCLRPLRSL